MNEAQASNEFKRAIERLLVEVGHAAGEGRVDAFLGSDGALLEHNTRLFFVDRMLASLGWELGPVGSLAAEARIKADTTTFMDYVGVNTATRCPLLIVETKAWDKPFIAKRTTDGNPAQSPASLLVRAIEHVKRGGAAGRSPVIRAWHDDLCQVHSYVSSLLQQYSHQARRVVYTSGRWLVVFFKPCDTFLSDAPADETQFELFEHSEYVQRSDRLLELLGRAHLSSDVPDVLRPSQVGTYVRPSSLGRTHIAAHVRYEETGSSAFARRPRILVYPAIILERDDGKLIRVQGEADTSMEEQDGQIDRHLAEVDRVSRELVATCSAELGVPLEPSDLGDFSGFPRRRMSVGKKSIDIVLVDANSAVPDEWMLVTGAHSHFLLSSPVIEGCRFHEWSACKAVGHNISPSALSTRSVDKPRAFFTDGSTHHCSHAQVIDRREDRCRIAPIDQRVCCQACIYLNVCWSADELAQLPCGR